MAAGSNRVPWERVDPSTYEKIVSALPSRKFPQLMRIDGAGGDRGRDRYWDTHNGREVFELKAFSGWLKEVAATLDSLFERGIDSA